MTLNANKLLVPAISLLPRKLMWRIIIFKLHYLSIFNRWGELIFESFDAAIGWDGTYNNRLAMSGINVWEISFETLDSNELMKLVGHVNLMK